jgi:hypothetical protein
MWHGADYFSLREARYDTLSPDNQKDLQASSKP